jgi:hypothetical protein
MTWLEPALRLAGVVSLGVICGGIPALRVLGFGRNLAGASQIVRHIVWFCYAWVFATVLAFAAMDLVFPETLAGGHPMGTFVCSLVACLWAARLVMQTLVYDRAVRRRHRVVDLAFVLAFAYLATVHAVAAVHGASGGQAG